VTLLALVGAIYVYRVGAGSSRKIAETDQLLGCLRSLQVGVVQTDGRDFITAGNDRAEELLAAPLPAFGLKQKPIYLWELFNQSAILVHSKKRILSLASLAGLKTADFRPRKFQELLDDRAAGLSSTYFVRLVERGPLVWLMVTGGPILRESAPRRSALWEKYSDDGDRSAGTFGVLEEVTGKMKGILENVFKRGNQS